MDYKTVVTLVVLLLAPCGAAAQLQDPDKLPKSGNLSTSLKSGAASAEVPEPFGGEDISGEKEAPITGSVSRTSRDAWTVKVFNNTKDEYSVDLDVIQVNMSGATVKTDSFSYRLKPGQSEEEKVSTGIGARDAELNLRNWKNLSKQKRLREQQVAKDQARDVVIDAGQATDDIPQDDDFQQ